MQITITDGDKTANTEANEDCTDNNNAALEMTELKHEVAQIASSQTKKKKKKRNGKSGNDKKKTEEEQEAKCTKLYKSMSKPEALSEMYTTWKPLHDLYLKNPYDYKGFRSEYAELAVSEKVKPEIRCDLSLSRPCLFVRIVVNGVPTTAFIDSGAYISFMSETFAKRSGVYEKIDTRERKITNGVGGTRKSIGTINLCSFEIAETNFEWRFDVLKDKYDVLIGIDFMRHIGCYIDIPRKLLFLNENKQVEFLSIAEIRNESRNGSYEFENYIASKRDQTVHSPGSPLFSSDSRGHYNLLIQNLDKIISEAKEKVPRRRTVRPFIKLVVNGVHAVSLVDTGFQSTNINFAFAKKSGLLPKIDTKHITSVIGFDVVKTIGTIFSCPFDIGDTQYEMEASVMKEEDCCSEDVVIGADFMQRHKCCIDLPKNRLIFDDNTHVEFLSASELKKSRMSWQVDV